MKRILICLEAMAHSYIIENNIESLMKLNPHPAVAFGLGSRPSAAALMGGMLPVCQIPRCHHRKLREVWNSPWFLSTMQQTTDKQYYLVGNGWIIEIFLPWMTQEQINKCFEWHDTHDKCPSTDIVDYFLKDSKDLDSYFAYLHFFESHFPFYSPKGTGNRKRSVEFVGEQVQRVIKARPEAEIVIVSDHNIPPMIESAAYDVPAATTMLSFIACNEQATKGKVWKELGIEPFEIAKKLWMPHLTVK
jgi:hypothetical protein